jgi:uncharacterized membrane protein YdjX (TVP38/TMEM64 family)
VPWGWLVASLIALPYLITSLVVVLNSIGNASGVVWLPSFPAWYYAFARVLYVPFQPYFGALSVLQSNPEIDYATFATISRAPFIVVGALVIGVTVVKSLGRRRGRGRFGALRLGGGQLALLGGALGALMLYAAIPPLRTVINAGVAALDPRDISRLRDFLLSFGPWAPAVSFLLMIVQSVAAPLPAFVITIANGLLFGWFWGTVLSWSSAMVGAALCYGIARALGRPVVERLVGGTALAKSDAIFDRYGSHAVLIARLIPLISFDVVSYAAGLTRIGLLPFLVATGIGQLPATIVYSVLGENITAGSRYGLWAVGALLSLVVIGVALRGRVERRITRHNTLVESGSTTP